MRLSFASLDLVKCCIKQKLRGRGCVKQSMTGDSIQPRAYIKNAKELEFVIFCIENIGKRLHIDAQQVYAALAQKSDILYEYIVPEYEVLHTQSKDYIIDDILEFAKERGVEI